MKFPRHNKIFRGQLDAGPYAAVFFLLIMFLLLNSSLVFTPGVPIHLPQAVNLPGTANPTVVVAVDASGQLYFENQVSSEERLKEKLRSAVANASEPLTLIVQADGDVRYENVVRLALLARAAGIKEALLATRPTVAPGPITSAK
jgi:biopolymer transport protein ExbD